jgi:DNA-binding protein
MATNQTVRWGKDEGGDRVVEVVSVRQLNANQAKNMLVLLDINIARAVEALEVLRQGRVELAALLDAGPNAPAEK